MKQQPAQLLRCANEPPLDSLDAQHAYRIFLLGSSTAPVSYVFRFTQNAFATKTCPSHVADTGPWADTQCNAPPLDVWGRLTSAIAAFDFWDMTPSVDNGAFDGAYYVLEGFRDGEYRSFSLRNPHSKLHHLVAELCNQCVKTG